MIIEIRVDDKHFDNWFESDGTPKSKTVKQMQMAVMDCRDDEDTKSFTIGDIGLLIIVAKDGDCNGKT